MNQSPKTRCLICGDRVVIGSKNWMQAGWLCGGKVPTAKHRVFEPGKVAYMHRSCLVSGNGGDESTTAQ